MTVDLLNEKLSSIKNVLGDILWSCLMSDVAQGYTEDLETNHLRNECAHPDLCARLRRIESFGYKQLEAMESALRSLTETMGADAVRRSFRNQLADPEAFRQTDAEILVGGGLSLCGTVTALENKTGKGEKDVDYRATIVGEIVNVEVTSRFDDWPPMADDDIEEEFETLIRLLRLNDGVIVDPGNAFPKDTKSTTWQDRLLEAVILIEFAFNHRKGLSTQNDPHQNPEETSKIELNVKEIGARLFSNDKGQCLGEQSEDEPDEYYFYRGEKDERLLKAVTFIPGKPDWISLMSGVHQRELIAETEKQCVFEREGITVPPSASSELPEHCKSAEVIRKKSAKFRAGEMNVVAICSESDPDRNHIRNALFGPDSIFIVDLKLPTASRLRLLEGIFCNDLYSAISAVLYVNLSHLRGTILGTKPQNLLGAVSESLTPTIFRNPFAVIPVPEHVVTAIRENLGCDLGTEVK